MSEPEQCDCLMCLAEGDNSPHRRRQAAAKAFKAVWEEALNGQDLAGAARGGLQGLEHSGRRLKHARAKDGTTAAISFRNINSLASAV